MKKLVCAAVSAGAAAVSPSTSAQDLLPQVSLTCEVRCSPTKLRTGVAIVRWSGPAEKVGAVALTGGSPSDVALDVTVFRKGFAQDRFASFTGFASGVRTLQKSSSQSLAIAGPPVKALENLQVTFVQGTMAPPSVMPDAGQVAVEVEGIEPGVLYRWRLRVPALGRELFATCEAPVCPADMQDEDKK